MTLTFLLIALAAYRLTRLVCLDDLPPVAWVRDRIDSFVRNRLGDHWAQGLTCPWCMGIYVSVAVVLVTDRYTSVALPVLQILACSTVVGLIGSKLEN